MSTENLRNQEGMQKLKEMVDGIDIGMLCTYPPESDYVYSVPMSRQEIDEDGNIWYLLSSESGTFKNWEKNDKMSVLFSKPSDYSFLSINGTGEISRDQARIDKYWNKFVEAWFDKGKEDPRIRVLQVKVQDAHYWDTKTNKLMTFLNLAASVVTGKKLDSGVEGELEV